MKLDEVQKNDMDINKALKKDFTPTDTQFVLYFLLYQHLQSYYVVSCSLRPSSCSRR